MSKNLANRRAWLASFFKSKIAMMKVLFFQSAAWLGFVVESPSMPQLPALRAANFWQNFKNDCRQTWHFFKTDSSPEAALSRAVAASVALWMALTIVQLILQIF